MQKEMKINTHNARKQEARILNRALRRKFLKLDKLVRRDFLQLQLDTAGYWKLCTLASLKIYFFFYKVCPELHSQNIIHNCDIKWFCGENFSKGIV